MTRQGKPRYQQLKDAILEQISEGELRPGDRVPSENDLVVAMSVSRMTANRALRELTDEGYVERIAGRGSFVSDFRAQSHVREVQNIADEIAGRGHEHSSNVIATEAQRANAEVARALDVKTGTAIFHLQLVHAEDGIPVQFEDRYVLPDFAPDCLAQDFAETTPSAYLTSVSPLQEAEQLVRAEMPDKFLRKLLHLGNDEPVLVVIRRTWATGRPVTFARLYHPGSRYELTGHYQPSGPPQMAANNVVQLGEAEKMNTAKTPKSRVIRAATGTTLQARSWMTEAPLRMLMNNLDPEVAERPEDLVVYGGIGKAARNWAAFDAIVESLKLLGDDETLLVQSGKPVGVFRTHADAPRVLIANSNLVPAWANWGHFRELDRKGLMMFGQMTAGSWIYIGSQGIVQGTYETFVEMGRQHYGGDLAGRWIVTAGLGGMGGAQPLAATMAGASMLAIECQSDRIDKRLETGYLDVRAESFDEAMNIIRKAVADKKAVSVGLLGNAAEILPEMVAKKIYPDALTDQTSAHDPANGYLPAGWSVERWIAERKSDPDAVAAAAAKSMARHVQAMLEMQKAGVPTFDYGNNIRQVALDEGVKDAFSFPGFVPAYVRPLFCRGVGPFRWVALSGDPEDIYKTDAKVKELIPDDAHLHAWLDQARERIQFQGLPARICWVGLGQRDRLGLAFNEMVRNGELKAPVVIGRDHLDSGSVASPNRETEAMRDGSDAVSDWPLLNALLNTASGATWVSLHHGGGVGMGYAQHAGVVIVCDGSEAADRRIARVLWNDPATGVMRHADAGYPEAIESATENNLNLPMLDTSGKPGGEST